MVAEESQEWRRGKTRVFVHRDIPQLTLTVSGLARSMQFPALKDFLGHMLLKISDISCVEHVISSSARKHKHVQ